MYFFIVSIGILIALEIPIIGRIIEGIRKNVRITFANLFGYDYIGAMIGSIVLPLVLLPKLGLIGASILVGMGNLFVAMLVGFRFRKKISKPLLLLPVIFFGLDIVFFIKAQSVENYIEQKFYDQQVIYQERSPYQRIVLTKEDNDLRLFLEGNIQFSSKDEYRYHESLVHVPLALLPQKKSLRVLILGGGDGLAARELLKYPRIREIVICDLDPAVTRLASTHPELLKINQNSLADPRVKLVHEDAYLFLEKFYRNPNRRIQKKWDFVIMDLPDPNNESLSKLYSVKFFQLVANVLEDDGVAVSQSTSPFHAREVFWCIEKTIRKSGFQNVYPYHLDVPSFGIWGMIAFSKEPLSFPGELKVASLSYLKDSLLPGFFSFPKDMDKLEVRHNTLFRPIILDYYEQSWKTY
jgi:spermidine synthase